MPNMKITPVIAAFASLALLAGCSSTSSSSSSETGTDTGVVEEATVNVSAEEMEFARQMLPHNDQAIDLAILALDFSENAEIVALAEQLIASQETEMMTLGYWLSTVEAEGTEDVPAGVITEEEYTELAGLTGAEFDKMFLELMIKHREAGLALTETISGSTAEEVVTVRDGIIAALNSELETMKALLETL
jgi:uncharacterized protein (DUF305 family)